MTFHNACFEHRMMKGHEYFKMNTDKKRAVRSYVLRQGRMTDAQKQAMDNLYSKFGIELQEKPIQFDRVFTRPGADTIVEIGFGMGQSLAEMAKQNPEKNYIGIEVHRPGVGRLMNQLEKEQITNVRVLNEDAVSIFEHHISADSLSGVQIFFPDPWPKKKHHKRRIIQSEFTKLVLSRLKKGGFIHAATDWTPYAEHIIDVFEQETELENIKDTSLYSQLLQQRPDTRFENRGKKLGHDICDVVYIRK